MILTKTMSAARRSAHRLLHNAGQIDHIRKGDTSPAGAALVAALGPADLATFNPDEQKRIADVEALRSRLLASNAPVATVLGDEHSEDDIAAAVQAGRSEPVGSICRIASKSPDWCRRIFRLLRTLRPGACIELGTCLGISGAYEAAALELNGAGRLISLEGNPVRAGIAAENFSGLGLTNVSVRVGLFSKTLEPALNELGTIDFAFIDGHHDGDATEAYFRTILPRMADNGVMVFDDITWSPGMHRAWDVISTDPFVRTAIDLFKVGVCVTGQGSAPPLRARVAVD